MTKINRHLLGRYVRQRGRRFELFCLHKFQQIDILARRIDESDRGLGYDIWLPRACVAVQCKCSANPKDLKIGLDELQAGLTPWNTKLLLCIHNLIEHPGARGELSFAGIFLDRKNSIYTFNGWSAILIAVRQVAQKLDDEPSRAHPTA